MLNVLATTLPIFAVIGIGFALVRAGILTREGSRALGTFVLYGAMPALVFRAVALRPISDVLVPSYLIAAAAGAFGAALIVYAVARLVLGRAPLASVVLAMGGCLANSGYVGFPIAVLVLGPPAGLALALSMLIENLLILPGLLAMADAAGSAGRGGFGATLRSTLGGLARNPLMLGLIAGLTVSLAGWPLPAPVLKTVDILANAATALALASIGGALVGLKPEGMVSDISLAVAAKLLLHPALVLLALSLLPPLPPDLHKSLLIIAAAPMMSIYPLLAERYGEGTVGAAALLVATVLSFFTMSALIGLL